MVTHAPAPQCPHRSLLSKRSHVKATWPRWAALASVGAAECGIPAMADGIGTGAMPASHTPSMKVLAIMRLTIRDVVRRADGTTGSLLRLHISRARHRLRGYR